MEAIKIYSDHNTRYPFRSNKKENLFGPLKTNLQLRKS
ncbi:unnamed protein product [Brassica oleracea]